MTIAEDPTPPTPGPLGEKPDGRTSPEKYQKRAEIRFSEESGSQADERRLNALLGPDGVVRTPARLAPWVRSLVMADLVAMRRSGRMIRGLDVLEFLDALDLAALSANGQIDDTNGRIEIEGGAGEILNSTLAAKVLECDPRTVRRVIKEEKLRGWKLGREWFTTKSDLDEYRFRKGKGHGGKTGTGSEGDTGAH